MSLESEVRRFIRVVQSGASPSDQRVAYKRLERYVEVGLRAEQVDGVDQCIDCRGTGKWANGMDCMRCTGKGYQTMADKRRNAAYDRKVMS